MNHGSPKSHQVRQEPAKPTPAVRALIAASRKAIKVLSGSRRAIFDSHCVRTTAHPRTVSRRIVTDPVALAWIEEHDVALNALRAAIARAQKDQP